MRQSPIAVITFLKQILKSDLKADFDFLVLNKSAASGPEHKCIYQKSLKSDPSSRSIRCVFVGMELLLEL